MKKTSRTALKLAALACGLVLLVLILWVVRYPMHELSLRASPLQFSIAPGSSLRSASNQMVEAGVLTSALPFELLTRIAGEPRSIKAGNYEVASGLTPYELMTKITRGTDNSTLAITFIEGWTFRQMRKVIDEHPGLRHDTQGLPEPEILKRLAISYDTAEGLFFPDTYHFSFGVSDLDILRRSHQLMQKHLAHQWEQRASDLPIKTPYDALILASIVEKETGRAAERPTISAVFQNRLKIGMKLQTDPTVIYGMGEQFDGNIRKNDLLTDTPYNTYTRGGMPPTPIAMPGLASLHAALNPASTDALYFVARGDGSSQFSRSLEEHEKAVTIYQRSGKRDVPR